MSVRFVNVEWFMWIWGGHFSSLCVWSQGSVLGIAGCLKATSGSSLRRSNQRLLKWSLSTKKTSESSWILYKNAKSKRKVNSCAPRCHKSKSSLSLKEKSTYNNLELYIMKRGDSFVQRTSQQHESIEYWVESAKFCIKTSRSALSARDTASEMKAFCRTSPTSSQSSPFLQSS